MPTRCDSFSQPPLAPDDLAAVSLGIAEERGLHRLVVDGRLGFEDETLPFELGLLRRHVIDPERHVADPALVDVRFVRRAGRMISSAIPWSSARKYPGGSPPLSSTTFSPKA